MTAKYGLKEVATKKSLASKAATALRNISPAKLIREKVAAEKSMKAATILQDKLKVILANKLPKDDMGSNYNTAVDTINKYVDNSNYQQARKYVASQLMKIKAQKDIEETDKKLKQAAKTFQKDLEYKKKLDIQNKPKLDSDRGKYYPSITKTK